LTPQSSFIRTHPWESAQEEVSMSQSDPGAGRSIGHRFMDSLRPKNLRRYGLTILCVAAALGLSLLLRYSNFRDIAVSLFLLAVAASSWYGGTGPAILAVLLSELAFDYFFLPPYYSLNIDAADIPSFVIFASFASLVSWFSMKRRRVEADLLHARDELNVLNQELAKRSAALESSNRELEAFAYSISHDLRAPLRHMAGFAELLRKNAEASLNEKSRRYLGMILEAASRMGTLIDDLLGFSRLSRAEAHFATVSLDQVVQEAMAEVRQDVNERRIAWRIDSLPQWYGDRSMLRLAMVNLISNAVKFTRTRQEAEIEIGCKERQDDRIVLFVRDNGVGFDMKYSDKLFGVFQRLHPQETFEGTGIGLATVQRIVHRHGGQVWAESKIEAGATFYFSLSKMGAI
jgi:signal transduction histidine kinase